MAKLPLEFYRRDDALQISKELLGKYLYSNIDGDLTGGMIVETEAYMAPEDKASHAFGNKKTPRTATFFKEGGIAYVYLCYGIHSLFNVITNGVGVPHAVLIRALEPIEGIECMLQRRRKKKIDFTLTSGPGALSKAMGITTKYNGVSLIENQLWLEDHGYVVPSEKIAETSRVGVSYAAEYATMPWRFFLKENPWVSKPNKIIP